MIMMSINVRDNASPALRRLVTRLGSPRGGLLVAARAVCNQLKQHFRAKDAAEPNKLGGNRTHFWLQIGHSVSQPIVSGATSVLVSISDPRFRQKLLGGEITPKRAKLLTIPVHPAAYGRRASVLEQTLGIKLQYIVQGRGAAVQALLVGPGKEGSWGFGIIYYLLVGSVHQAPTPGALPSEGSMLATALGAFRKWAERLIARAGGTI